MLPKLIQENDLKTNFIKKCFVDKVEPTVNYSHISKYLHIHFVVDDGVVFTHYLNGYEFALLVRMKDLEIVGFQIEFIPGLLKDFMKQIEGIVS